MSNTTQDPNKVELDRDRRLEQMSRHAQGLTDLLARRRDLSGVHQRADYLAESVFWGV
jgi:hypothetical protein